MSPHQVIAQGAHRHPASPASSHNPTTPAGSADFAEVVLPLARELSLAIVHARCRPWGIPGVVLLEGAGGMGKSVAARQCAYWYHGALIQGSGVMTMRSLLAAIAHALGCRNVGSLSSQGLLEAAQGRLKAHDKQGHPRVVIVDDVQRLLGHLPEALGLLFQLLEGNQAVLVLVGDTSLARTISAAPHQARQVLMHINAAPLDEEGQQALAACYGELQVKPIPTTPWEWRLAAWRQAQPR